MDNAAPVTEEKELYLPEANSEDYTPPNVLIVDDDPTLRKVLHRLLVKEGFKVHTAETGKEIFRSNILSKTDVVLLDLVLGSESGIDVLRRIREIAPQIAVIMLTGFADVKTAVEAMKEGAYQYIEKPCDIELLKEMLEAATYSAEPRDGPGLKKVPIIFGSRKEYFCYGRSMDPVFLLARKAALGGDSTILISGASGTGKELLARYIHGLSSRKNKSFVAINCGALPKDLMESELFGYEAGAFTGACSKGKLGLVQQAEGGTLLLDEVGELPIDVQTKLLRFLETKEYYQLGGIQLTTSNARIMASTNVDLSAAIKDGKFRKDLFYRLNVVHINLPPLSERKDEVMPLAEHFLEIFSRKYNNRIQGFRDGAVKFMNSLPWEGNVRELRNMIERGVIVTDSTYIDFSDLDPMLNGDRIDKLQIEIELDLKSSPNPLAEVKQEVIMKVIDLAGGNKSKASKLLKIPRSTLRFYLEKGIGEE